MKAASMLPDPGPSSWLGRTRRKLDKPHSPLLWISILLGLVALLYINTVWQYVQGNTARLASALQVSTEHPITRLIEQGRARVAALDLAHHLPVNEAAKAYRSKRGRHPPPGFDKWLAFAESRNRSTHEDFFDQIYEDMEPFWGKDAASLRDFATTFSNSITIRDGEARFRIEEEVKPSYYHMAWVTLWLHGLDEISAELPDLDIPLNPWDETRVVVPWEDMAAIMEKSAKTKHTRAPTEQHPILDQYTSYPNLTEPPKYSPNKWDGIFDDSVQKWVRARVACPPDSPAKSKEINETGYPHFTEIPHHFVHNLTQSRNVCEQPDLYNFHSAFIRPNAPPTTPELWPLFGACKIVGVSNDVLLPPGLYMLQPEDKNTVEFRGGTPEQLRYPWADKKSTAFWRGSDSGGHQDLDTWRYYQRTRMASMMNGTGISAMEPFMRPATSTSLPPPRPDYTEAGALGAPFSFPWPEGQSLAALASSPSHLGEWASTWGDGGITNTYMCQWFDDCRFLWPYFENAPQVKMWENFRHKFLPDVDGFSYSGRYNAFLRSSSVPVKATVYAEWHHSRLVPWQHFVPMDNTMRDWFGIMEYFVGYNASQFGVDEALHREAHDAEAEEIATRGMDWAEQHLSRDDMIVYIYRLLLEYARICDDRREDMGWTADLVQQ